MAGPIMIKTGYNPVLLRGDHAGGTLGILIPPSVMLIVMGPVLGVSVADLYASAFGPAFCSRASILLPGRSKHHQPSSAAGSQGGARHRHHRHPEGSSRSACFRLLLLIVATLGSILAGLATPRRPRESAPWGVDSCDCLSQADLRG